MKRMILAAPAIFGLAMAPAAPVTAQTAKPGAASSKAAAPEGTGKIASPATTSAGPKTPTTSADKPKTTGPRTAVRPSAASATMTEDEKALFALGAQLGEQYMEMVKPLELSPGEIEALKKGLSAGVEGKKSPYPFEQYRQRLSARAEANMARESTANKEKGAAFGAAAAAEAGATKSASGLVFRSLQAGQGERPKATDVVRVNYRGSLIDGSEFDASQGGPATFPLTGVVPCWTEGLQLMQVGEKARLVCPPELAYGDRGQGRIAPGSTLVFEVELVGIEAATAAPAPAEK